MFVWIYFWRFFAGSRNCDSNSIHAITCFTIHEFGRVHYFGSTIWEGWTWACMWVVLQSWPTNMLPRTHLLRGTHYVSTNKSLNVLHHFTVNTWLQRIMPFACYSRDFLHLIFPLPHSLSRRVLLTPASFFIVLISLDKVHS